jgi:gluconate 5-dehydrogenase
MRVRELFDLTGKVAVVTGGSRGLGRVMAEALGEAGAHVAITARHGPELEEAAAELRGRGVAVTPVVCDVTRPEEVEGAVGEILGRHGRIDILVNNAGAAWGASPQEMPLDAWRRVLDTNVTGMFLVTQAVGRSMLSRREGAVINVASIAGLKGLPPLVLDAIGYSASKGAVIAFTRDLAVKWAPFGIRVNAIAPGFFPSKMTRWLIEHRRDHILSAVPLGRLGEEDDLKGVVVFLASRAAGFVTGHVLPVDGGMAAW